MDTALDILLEVFSWLGLGAGVLLAAVAVILWAVDGTWLPADAIVDHEDDGTVAFGAQGGGGVRHLAAHLEETVRRSQLRRRLGLVRDAQDPEHDREERGHQPDGHQLPDQRPVARAQSVRPGVSGFGAGHAHVPRLLFDTAVADDVRPHCDTRGGRFAIVASRGVLCPRWMTGTEMVGACRGSVGLIEGPSDLLIGTGRPAGRPGAGPVRVSTRPLGEGDGRGSPV